MSNKIKCLYFPPPKKTQSSSLTCGVLLYWTTGIIIRSRPLFPVKHCSRFILDPARCSSPPTVWLRSKILMFRSRIISVFVPSLADASPSISFKKLVNYRSGIFFNTNKNWLFGWLRLVITNFTFGWGQNRCRPCLGWLPGVPAPPRKYCSAVSVFKAKNKLRRRQAGGASIYSSTVPLQYHQCRSRSK